MHRFYVLMWSNFLIFRLLLFVLTPVFEATAGFSCVAHGVVFSFFLFLLLI